MACINHVTSTLPTNDLLAYSSSREGKAGLASNRGPGQHSNTIALTSNTSLRRQHHEGNFLSPNHPPSADPNVTIIISQLSTTLVNMGTEHREKYSPQHLTTLLVHAGGQRDQRYCLSPNHPPSVDAGEHDEHYFDSGTSHRGPE